MDRQIRFGIAGTGKITEWFLKGACQDGRFVPVAVCSRSIERAREFAATHDIRLTFSSPEEMAASGEIDAVYIATPNSTHARYAMLFMDCGKHVLCEKPIASNARECRMMIDCARRNGVLLMEAMIATMNPNFDILRHRLGDIGVIRRYFAGFCQYSSRYDALKTGVVEHAFDPDYSTGALMDIGVYTIYPMVALFGRPDRIDASGVMLSTGVDGHGAVNFTYPGMNATVFYSKIVNSYLPSEIEGEDGTFLIDRINTMRSLTWIKRPVATAEHGEEYERKEIGHELEHDPYYYEVKEFMDLLCLGKTESPVNSLDTSLITMEIMDEVRRQLGVTFPADK